MGALRCHLTGHCLRLLLSDFHPGPVPVSQFSWEPARGSGTGWSGLRQRLWEPWAGGRGWEQPGKAPLTSNILCAPLQCQSPTAHPSLWLPCDLAPSWAGGGRARGQGSCQLRGTAIDHLHGVGAGTEEGWEPLRQPPNSVCLAGSPGSFPTRAASLLCARCTLAQVWRQPGLPHHVNQVWAL